MLGGLIGAGLLGLSIAVPTVVRGWTTHSHVKYSKPIGGGHLVIVKLGTMGWVVYFWDLRRDRTDPISGPVIPTSSPEFAAREAERWYRGGMRGSPPSRYHAPFIDEDD